MKTPLAYSLVIAFIGVSLTQCPLFGEHRYFPDERATIEHFKNNRAQFERVVKVWQASSQAESFGLRRWDNDSLSWNGTVMRPLGSGFEVEKGKTKLAANASFDDAAVMAGAKPSELRWWKEIATQLEIGYVQQMGIYPPIEERYIEVWLRGSEKGPYGLIFVPENHRVAYDQLLFEASGHIAYPHLRVTRIDGRWFYFESKL